MATTVTKDCLMCEKPFDSRPVDKRKFCSAPCRQRGRSEEGILKLGLKRREKENIGYSGIHAWVKRRLGKPDTCSRCGNKGGGNKMQWANKSGQYLRDLDDWERLCITCHNKYYKHQHNYWGKPKILIDYLEKQRNQPSYVALLKANRAVRRIAPDDSSDGRSQKQLLH